jgi:hypothetical protein
MSQFLNRRVGRSLAQAVDLPGSKPKFWFRQASMADVRIETSFTR